MWEMRMERRVASYADTGWQVHCWTKENTCQGGPPMPLAWGHFASQHASCKDGKKGGGRRRQQPCQPDPALIGDDWLRDQEGTGTSLQPGAGGRVDQKDHRQGPGGTSGHRDGEDAHQGTDQSI